MSGHMKKRHINREKSKDIIYPKLYFDFGDKMGLDHKLIQMIFGE